LGDITETVNKTKITNNYSWSKDIRPTGTGAIPMMRNFILALSLLIYSQVSSSASLVMDGTTLTGATGILIGGNSYDVDFVGEDKFSTYENIFDGCNEIGNFLFQTYYESLAASTALLMEPFTKDQTLTPTPA